MSDTTQQTRMTFEEWADGQDIDDVANVPDPIITDKQRRIAYNAWHARDAELDRARIIIKQLVEFSDHARYCRTWKEPDKQCDCGHDDAVKAAEEFFG